MQMLQNTPAAAQVPASGPAAAMSPGVAPAGPVLRDIHMPADPSWWPPAPGWWVLAAVLLVLAVVWLWWWRRQQRRQQWRARVLVELDEAELRFRQDGNRPRLLGELHALMRRAAAGLDPAARSARGKDWEALLGRVRIDASTRQQLLALEQTMYQPDGGSGFEAEPAIAAVRRWMTLVLRKLAAEQAGRQRRSS